LQQVVADDSSCFGGAKTLRWRLLIVSTSTAARQVAASAGEFNLSGDREVKHTDHPFFISARKLKYSPNIKPHPATGRFIH
jgi:hypothetical protein